MSKTKKTMYVGPTLEAIAARNTVFEKLPDALEAAIKKRPCEALVHIVEEQRKALAQHDALVLEDEIAKTRSRYTALLGAEEWPDDCQQQEE